MKKSKTIIFQKLLCFLVLAMTLQLQAQDLAEKAPNTSNSSTSPSPIEAQWDVQFDYDISDGPNLGGLAGAVHIGNEFWVSVWNGDTLVRYENNGTFIEKFAMPNLFNVNSGGVRAMTWDGTSIWAAMNTSTIFQVDPATKSIVSQINVTGTTEAIRFLSYDETADGGNGGFWAGNFNTDIFLLAMDGTLLSVISADTHGLGGMYGAAIDNDSPGGPYLWVFHQAGVPSNALITQLSLPAGTATGVGRDVNIDFNLNEALAGGMFISKDWDPNGGMVLGGVAQTAPDRLFGYELDFMPSELVDAGTANLTSPQTGCDLSNAETVTFEINNLGETNLINIPLELLVNGMSMSVDTFFGILTPGNSTSFTFTNTIDLSVPGNYIIGVRTTEPTDINNANNLTNWVIGSKALSNPPLVENFDGFADGTTIFSGLYNSGAIPFEVNAGATTSNNTGPVSDASGTGNYIYMETSGRAAGDVAILTSDCINLMGPFTEANLTFDYHMFGAAIGNLNVEIVSGGITTSALILNGQQQTADIDPWETAVIDLSTYIGSEIEVFITGTIGTGGQAFLSDIGLDNFSLVACTTPEIGSVLTPDFDGTGIGGITLSLSGGTMPFSFLWSNGAETQDLAGVTAGTYSVSISDGGSCTYVREYVVEDLCESFAVDGTVTDANGAQLGSIDLNVSGGMMPYTFEWSTGAMTEDLIDLPGGDYFCSITDGQGCGRFLEFTVDDIATAVEDIEGLSVLELAPNPSNGFLQIQLELAQSMDVQFTLLDLTGREVMAIQDNNLQTKTYTLDLMEKSDGIYLARFVLDGQVVSRKVVLNK